MQEGDPILGGDANNVSGGQTHGNGNEPSLSDASSSDPSELKISHDSPAPPPVHILGQDITGITDEDFKPLPPNPEPTPQIIMPTSSPETPAESTAPETPATPEANAASGIVATPTDPNAAAAQAPAVEAPAAAPVAAPLPQAPAEPVTPAVPTPAQPAAPAPESNYAAEFKQSVKASVSGESGDIILSKDPRDPKKTRRGLIIGIVVAVIVVIVLCICMIFLNQNKQTNLSTIAISPLEKTFNSYANQLLYGKDSIDPIPDEEDDLYYIQQKSFDSSKESLDYINEIKNKYEIFYNQYTSEKPKESDETTYNLVTNNKELLEFFATNPSTQLFQIGRITEAYLQHDIEDIDDAYTDLFKKYSHNTYGKEFVELRKVEYENITQYLSELEIAGCITDTQLDRECEAQVLEVNPDLSELYQTAVDYDNQARNLLNNFYTIATINCLDIKRALEGKS